LYPEITRDTQKSSQKSNRSRTIRNQKLINSNSINKHVNIVSLQWWGFILNPIWEFSYTWLRKAKINNNNPLKIKGTYKIWKF
jgi:hypothetical protein